MSAESVRSSPITISDEFVTLITGDLYGPAGGPEETLSEYNPAERYLLGMLAPKGSAPATDPARLDDAPVHAEDGDEPFADTAASAPSLFPASKGLSFAVPISVRQLAVSASWGRYARELAAVPLDVAEAQLLVVTEDAPPEAVQKPAGAGHVWRRYPSGGTHTLDVEPQGGPIAPFSLDADCPEVVVQGRSTRHGDFLLFSLFLVNEQPPRETLKDEAWLFQAELAVAAVDGSPIFVGRDSVLESSPLAGSAAEQQEIAALNLQYRNYVEFAVGHGTAVHIDVDPTDPKRAVRISTTSVPSFEVPRTEPPRADEPGLPDISAVTFDMSLLAAADDPAALVERLSIAYSEWLDVQAQRLSEPGVVPHADAALKAIADARKIAQRLGAGASLLRADAEAAEAFRFANWAMWTQRVRSLAADRVRRTGESFEDCLAVTDMPANRSWRPFQLAFILLNLESLTDPTHKERTSEALVDLLFFPTGGGKTEAYLGLTAYTFAIRRLQGTRFGLDGSDGLAVLMRYTLRLLTAQQFQRAAALVAACEIRRRQKIAAGDERWGTSPFRIGLWVGSSVTPNSFTSANQVVVAGHAGGKAPGKASPVQLTACPWCGRSLSAASDARPDSDLWRTLLYCSDKYGDCPFTQAGEERDGISREGIPVVTVDEEIYRLLPSLIISTADKFAQLPWQGPLHLLFGKASRKCTRHGYRSADLDSFGQNEEKDSHPKKGSLPSASTIDVTPLRPVDLIIQDELHLISGPLGSLAGLYETAIDALATWQLGDRSVRPKVIASTATVRRAADQVHALFARRLAVFPPPIIDVENNFFSVQRPTREDPNNLDLAWAPGRLYIGVCAFGHRLKAVQARVFITLLAAGQQLFDRYGDDADPYLTMIGYYNALRELAGGRRLIDDDVKSRLPAAYKRGLGRRRISIVEELTSRVSSSDIPATLDQLGQRFTKAGEDARRDPKLRTTEAARNYRPIDVLLATNMISVGVDVPRLGLMVTIGQPKATSEYIQATSRVGRSTEGPGVVLTIYNWARPRDLSHFETFEQYHATFYRSVEALSVTPFAPRAIDRGLTGVLVSLVRHNGSEKLPGSSWNPDLAAQGVPATSALEIQTWINLIAERGQLVTGDPDVRVQLEEALQYRLERWEARQAKAAGVGAKLTFRNKKGDQQPLLQIPAPGKWDEWSCPNSLRETEATVNLQIDLWDKSLDHAAAFRAKGAGDSSLEGQLEAQLTLDDLEGPLLEEEGGAA